MPPVASNHGGHLPDMESVTVDHKGFHMAPLPFSYRIGAIYNIRFKKIYLDPFRPFYVKSGERAQ